MAYSGSSSPEDAERFYLSEEELNERVETLLPPKESITIPILKKHEENASTPTTVLVVGMAGSGMYLCWTQSCICFLRIVHSH